MRTSQYILFFMNMFSGMAYSIIAPLFPIIADRHGITEEILGYLISICAFSSFIASPFAPILIKNFGRYELLYISTFIEATCVVLYGFSNYIPSYYSFIILSFTIRIIHGIFCGILSIIIYSLISSISTDDEIQLALGNMEVAWCIGLSAGPLFASIFYQIGGFTLPFLALGSLLYISVYLTKIISVENINTIKEEEEEQKEEYSILKSIFHINIMLNLGTVTIGIIATTFYFPCLTNHLTQKYHLNISIASLFFIVGMVFYMLFLRFLIIITKNFGMQGTPCLGLLMTSIGCLFIYPVPPIPQNVISILFGLCLTGGAGAPLNVPAIINMSMNLKLHDKNLDEFTANDISSTLYTIGNNIGDFIGPTLGGFLSSKFGFNNCCLIISAFIIFYLTIFLMFFYSDIKKEIQEKYTEHGIYQIKNELEKSIISTDTSNTFIVNVNDIFGNYHFFIHKKFSLMKNRSTHINKLNRSLISSLTA